MNCNSHWNISFTHSWVCEECQEGVCSERTEDFAPDFSAKRFHAILGGDISYAEVFLKFC
jgi:hypothetical protein